MLKKHVHELEIELPVDLKEIPTKLDDITKNVTSLASQVAELKTLQWELPAEFISLPTQVASVQAKLKTLDALPSLLLNVTQALNKKTKAKKSLSSEEAEKESTDSDSDDETHMTGFMKLEEDAKAKAVKQEGEVRKAELVDLLGPEVVKRQDFVTIEDLKDFSNTMLYTVQEIFFRRHQGHGLDDHARTFSSLLLAEID
ncbi:hypothetical protein Tco_0640706 [Tanacetum coccineum]